MKSRRLTAPAVLCFVLLLVLSCLAFAACGGGNGQEQPTEAAVSDTAAETPTGEQTDEPSGGTETEPASEVFTEPGTEPETEEAYIVNNHHEASEAGAENELILHIADYGAVGDGKTDDGNAVSAAVRDAAAKHATLQFEAGKTYLLGQGTNSSGPFKGPLTAAGVSGFTIDGQGCTFLMKHGVSFFSFSGCSDVRVENCVFDTAVSVYMVGTVKSVNGQKVTFSTDIEPNADSFDFTGANGFCIKYNEGVQNRPHRFISTMKKTASREVEVTYRDQPDVSTGDLVFLTRHRSLRERGHLHWRLHRRDGV